jgi:hypothetical protein
MKLNPGDETQNDKTVGLIEIGVFVLDSLRLGWSFIVASFEHGNEILVSL